jgi:hypothetical protein
VNEDEQTFALVGKLAAYKVLLGEAGHNGCDAFTILEVDRAILDIGEQIFDFATDDWNNQVRRHDKADLPDYDVLILAKLRFCRRTEGRG